MRERQLAALSDLDGATTSTSRRGPAHRGEVAPPAGAIGAYYVPPERGLSRPGTVWYSPGNATVFPLYDEITTAYHEGFPGITCSARIRGASRRPG